jgi:dolichol-phosphate mannosyltransferase
MTIAWQRATWRTLTRFTVVGASGVAVNMLALYVLYQRAHVPLVVASALAVELAIASNFFWNNRWTFQQTGHSLARFAVFNAVSLVGLLVTAATVWLLVQLAGVNYLVANLTGIGLAAACNFVANVQWTWRQ